LFIPYYWVCNNCRNDNLILSRRKDQIVITTIVTNPVVRYEQRNDQIVITTIVTNPVVRYEQRKDQIVITTIVTNPVVRYEQRKDQIVSDPFFVHTLSLGL
jgi:hypothetical protein